MPHLGFITKIANTYQKNNKGWINSILQKDFESNYLNQANEDNEKDLAGYKSVEEDEQDELE